MNSHDYEKIKQVIITNPSLTRDETFKIVSKLPRSMPASSKPLQTNQTIIEPTPPNPSVAKQDLGHPLKENKNPNVKINFDFKEKKESDAKQQQQDQQQPETIPISYQTFISIYSNLKRRQMFKTSMWRKLKENAFNFSQKYSAIRGQQEADEAEQTNKTSFKNIGEKMKNNIILNMAKEINVSPVLMARLIVEGLLKTNSIELIENIETTDRAKLTISNIIRDNHLLKDGRLACEIMECCSIDEDYGPIIDTIKNLSGSEHEMKLEAILKEKGIAFIKESELREKGYDKTPDFKLELPIFLNDSGRVISWIDSKGTFGDETSHSEYYETQFKFYLNRFGSGLVIYWLGHVKELESLNTNLINRSVVVSDNFPSDFTVLNLEPFVEQSANVQ